MGLAAFNRSRRLAAEVVETTAVADLEAREEAARKKAEKECILEALREKANLLGIENAGRKGEERLKEEIAAAEAEIEKERIALSEGSKSGE